MSSAEAGNKSSIGRTDDQDDILVRFAEVQKSYDGVSLVVKNLNLDIANGEFLTMLAPPAPARRLA